MTNYQHIISTYRSALPPGRLKHFVLTPIDRTGVPFHLLTLYQDHGPTNAGSGYGMSNTEALMGAFGELAEVSCAHAALQTMPRERGSYNDMVKHYGAQHVIDPRRLCLDAGVAYTPDRPLQWVTTQRYRSGESVYVPLEFVACQNSDVSPSDWLVTLITNGLGAGLTREAAIGHGLLELIQRDGNSVAFRALAGDTAIALDDVQDTQIRGLLDQLDQQGIDVVVKLASTEFGMPNMYVVGMDREPRADASPIMALACGEAAHPNREHALRKALLEFAAARARVGFSHGPLEFVRVVTPEHYLDTHMADYDPAKDEARALEAMQTLTRLSFQEMRDVLEQQVLNVRHTIPFSTLPTLHDQQPLDRDALARRVADRVLAAGFEILVAYYTPPESAVQAVKVIVPGLEVETMSYRRIGERNLARLLEQEAPFVGVGAAPEGALHIHLTEEAEERLGGPGWLDPAALDATVGLLYPLYREPARHAAAWLDNVEK